MLMAAMIAVSFLRAYQPLFYKKLINLLAGGPAAGVLAAAINLLIIIFLINFTRIGIWRGINFLNNYFQSRVMADLVQTCYKYLQKHSLTFFNSNFLGSLVTKVKRYERAFELLADRVMFNLGRPLVELVIIIVFLSRIYRPLAVILLLWTLAYVGFVYFYAHFRWPYDLRRAATDTETTAQLADSITNNLNIKIFSNYLLEFKKFGEVAENQFHARKKSWHIGTVGEIIQSLSMIGLEFGLMIFAVKLFQKNVLTVGDIALIQAYLFRIFDQLWDTGKYIRDIYESLADANEMTEILLLPHEVRDARGAGELKIKNGRIDFKNVSFGYHKDVDVLDNFNLTITPGERVALIGPSGEGKSTIVKLLFRFYDIASGKILIDGQNIEQTTQDSLRAQLSLVPQDPILFHRSLMDNIRYARPSASDNEIIEAAKKAHAHEFISAFPEGYNTLVGERGVKLSGGERQRVAIARAILKNAPILVLDEATSSLDSESEMFIQDALKSLMRNTTTIVIAHRLSTIMQMDKIYVIDNGKIVEQGKHEELLKIQQGLYQRLWEIQAGGFSTA